MFADLPNSTVAVLGERDVNTSSPSKALQSEKEVESQIQPQAQAQAQALKQTPSEPLAPAYVSPSDNIQSPTTRKLSEMKGKRYANVKPQSLFTRTLKKEGLKSQDKHNNASA